MDKPKIQLSSVVSRDQRFPSATVGEGLTMAGDDPEHLYRLEGVGKRIWELIEAPVPVSEVCTALEREFQVEAESCQQDVLAFLEDLREKGLVKVSAQPPAASSS